MDKWIFEFFLEGIMAFQTEFPLGARFQLEFILLRRTYRKNQQGDSSKP
jgi:hypothetical protein